MSLPQMKTKKNAPNMLTFNNVRTCVQCGLAVQELKLTMFLKTLHLQRLQLLISSPNISSVRNAMQCLQQLVVKTVLKEDTSVLMSFLCLCDFPFPFFSDATTLCSVVRQ